MTEEYSERPDSVPKILQLNYVFEGLAHPRRRYLLYSLQVGTDWTLKDLAVKIANWENGTGDTRPTDDHIEAVYVSLYHNHIPKLVDDDILEFDEATERIKLGPNAEQVMNILETAGGTTDSQLESHARNANNER